MTWKTIRLELARTPEFPEGSPRHAYQLHLPLGRDGIIDEAAWARARERAIAIRLWPGERDLHGYVIRVGSGWAISYRRGEEDDERLFHLETHALVPGNYLTLTEQDGHQLPFKVAEVAALA